MQSKTERKARIQILVTGLLWSALSAVFFVHFHYPIRGWIFGALALLFVGSALFVPPMARGIHKVLSTLTQVLITTVSFTLLGLIYYLIMTPLGVILRLKGALKTTTRPDPALTTYWVDRPRQPFSAARYLRPF